MKAGELLDMIDQSSKVEIIEDKETIFCGWNALFPYNADAERIREAEVRKFQARTEITHQRWKEKGLAKPLMPEETPDYSFSDLQLTIYNSIYI